MRKRLTGWSALAGTEPTSACATRSIRLGLAGLRAAEIIHLRVGDLRLHELGPRIEWIGKKRRARRFVPGPTLAGAMEALMRRQEALLCRRLGEGEAVLNVPPKFPPGFVAHLVIAERGGVEQRSHLRS